MSMDLKNLMTTLVMVIRVDMVTTPVGISATLPPTTVKCRFSTTDGGDNVGRPFVVLDHGYGNRTLELMVVLVKLYQ